MNRRLPKYPMEEHARHGREIYARLILPRVAPEDKGKVVAIDIDTESFEIAAEAMEAADRLLQRLLDAQI